MPAPAVITCPSCKKRFKGKPELAGKKIKCPGCAEPFTVPSEDDEKPAKTKAAAKSEVEAPADDEAYGIGRIDVTPRCPHCAKELISADAVVCVYCGYNTLTRTLGKTKKVISASPEQRLKHLLPGLICAAVIVFLIVEMILVDTVALRAFMGTNMGWAVDEWARMWSTIIHLFIIFPLGVFAFNRLAIHPRPPEVEKE